MNKLLFLPLALFFSTSVSWTGDGQAVSPITMSRLQDAAEITRDTNGIAHIRASNEHDLFFLQGYVHAQDRLFQIDLARRQASGTLAEVLGKAALASDVQLRTFGLRRAAQQSHAILSVETKAALTAYAEGVNAYVASNPLPPEYAGLKLTKFEPWTALDSVVVGQLLAFSQAFDLSDIDRTVALLGYQQAGSLLGFNGTALFFEDLFRAAPFDGASTIPDALGQSTTSSICCSSSTNGESGETSVVSKDTGEMARKYLEQVRSVPFLEKLLDRDKRDGSNGWAVSGPLTTSGRPFLANDTHLTLGTPSTWYPIHLVAEPLNVAGDSLPGAPFVILGQNHFISWGATNNPVDLTDVYQEMVVSDTSSPSGLSTLYRGSKEPVIPIPEIFRQNNMDGKPDNITVVPSGGAIPAATLIVPRRNNGPIVSLDLKTGSAMSVQYTGFSAGRDLDAIYGYNKAENLADFRRALQYFDYGAMNWIYADPSGYIAYMTGDEVPIREDLQAGAVNGLPPYFLRNGMGGNEWLPVQHPQPGQAIPYEILTLNEMPHMFRVSAGWFVNANNDPVGNTLDNNPLNELRPGGGIFYLSPGYSSFRAGRITQLVRQRLGRSGKLSFRDMQEIQADVVLLDAQYFVPFIHRALSNAQLRAASLPLAEIGKNPLIAEMVRKLSAWDFTTPTGLPRSFNTGGQPRAPSKAEIAASVAATLYSVWRGQFIRNTIDVPLNKIGLAKPDGELALTALRNLLDNFAKRKGVGVSGMNFFNVPGVDKAEDRRDLLILKCLGDTIGLLSGDSFAAAFGKSANLDDYRWGKLHRIVFSHPLGSPLSVPPAMGAFPAPLAGLTGIPSDGGYQTPDSASHNVRADSLNGFMFAHGPARRFVSEAGHDWIRGVNALPGGISGVPGSPYYTNLLPQYLTNTAYTIFTRQYDIKQNAVSVTKFVPFY